MRVLLLALPLTACAAPLATPTPGLPPGTVVVPVEVVATWTPRMIEPAAIVSSTSVAELAIPTGVAVVPETGQRLVVTEAGDVFDLETGAAVWTAPPTAPAAAPFGYTDLVAIDANELAITSVGDGWLVELATHEMTPHFCYEPGGWEEVPNEPVQVSWALAIDRVAGRLYAQPHTIENGGYGTAVGSFVAAYDVAGGADVAWWSLPDPAFTAPAMTVIPSGALLLGHDAILRRFDPATAELSAAADLGGLEIDAIEGLAVDEAHETLLVLDGPRAVVVEIGLASLGL